jgi:glycogen synthase
MPLFTAPLTQHPPIPTLLPALRACLAFAALDRALRAYKEKPEEWKELRGRIMADAMRFSWDTTAGTYINLYGQVLSM